MKRREFNKSLAFTTGIILSPFSRVRIASAATGGGATLVFGYPSGFSGAISSGAIQFAGAARLNGSSLAVLQTESGHNSGAAWYATKQPSNSFTTQFTFRMPNLGASISQTGMSFCIQNTVWPPGAAGDVGLLYRGDANMCGYGQETGQYPPIDSIGIKFDAGNISINNFPTGGMPSSTGFYLNGGPAPQNTIGELPFNDLSHFGINFYSGHVFACTIVYDGSLLTMVLQDTTTNAQVRFAWPLNLANTTNATGNYVGFTGGTSSLGAWECDVLTWSYWTGYNARLSTPTFSPAPGQYSGTQSVAISAPAGSTIYYTTNGLLPTSTSTQYTGAISVSGNEIIQAVAIQSGFTDSLVATGAYQINTANLINLPSGFGTNDGVIAVGYAYKSGSSLVLTDQAITNVAGAGWFGIPVNIATFSTNFTLQFNNAASGANGMCFVIQNDPPAYSSSNNTPAWSGGPTTLGYSQTALGYGGLSPAPGIMNSIAVAFDLYTVPYSVGLYTGGATPLGSQRATRLNFNNGHPFTVALSYNGTTLSITITDTVTQASFATNWTINIPSAVGGNTAYVGFTGGTGGGTAIQRVVSWTYTASAGQTAAVPAAPTNFRVQ